MSKIVWDAVGAKKYETGTDHGVLFPVDDKGAYGSGVAWDGLVGVSESPSGAEPTTLWADNIEYGNIMSAEKFGFTIEAYQSPEEFDECDGTVEIAPGVVIGQQDRKKFGFSYRTIIGNDVKSNAFGYKLHLVYGALAAPSEKGYQSVTDSPEAITLSWECSTTPVSVKGFKPTAHLVIDSTRVKPEKLAALEEILYGKDAASEGGSDGVTARLPLPDEVAELLKEEPAA